MAEEPLDEYVDPAIFGTVATYTLGHAISLINVVFLKPYEALRLGTIEIENAAPTAICRSADVPGVDHTATLTIDGVTYYVHEVKPDGTGITELVLAVEP